MRAPTRLWSLHLGASVLAGSILTGGLAHGAPDRPTAPPTERGSEPGSGASPLELTVTAMVDAARGGRWAEVVAAHRRAEDALPAHLDLLAARAHERLDALEPAADLLLRVLEGRPDHLEALYLLARVRLRQGDPDGACRHLLASARAGQSVLRDIGAGGDRALFAPLLDDPGFVLALLRSGRDTALAEAELRDPFVRPAGPPPSPEADADEEPADAAQRAELAREIEALLERLEGAAARREHQELSAGLTELGRLLERFGAPARALVSAELARWRSRAGALREGLLSIQLQVWVSEGNQHLRAMVEAHQEGQPARTLEHFERLQAVCQRLRTGARDVFRRCADELEARGARLRDRARVEQRIASLPLRVSGIVVPGPDERPAAIVNDRVVREGQRLEEPRGVEVVRIQRSSVTFRCAGVEFVRAPAPTQ